MKVLITGGAGFIGANLSRALTRSSAIDEVRVLDDLSTGTRANLDGVDGVEVRFTEGSVLDYELLRKVSDGVDSIVHLAAIASVPLSLATPATHDAGATGTLNVFEAARELGVPHVVVASSSAVYGSNPKLPISEDDWTRPLSPYAVSKMATEGYALAYQASYGMKTLAFRFFNVYGPLQPAEHAYAAVIPKFIDAALTGRPLTICGDGTQSRDFTFVTDICQVIVSAVVGQVSGPADQPRVQHEHDAAGTHRRTGVGARATRLERVHEAPGGGREDLAGRVPGAGAVPGRASGGAADRTGSDRGLVPGASGVSVMLGDAC